MEVMGLMLGQFIDEYTVRVIDVFAMPQSGTVSTVLKLRYLYRKHKVAISIKISLLIIFGIHPINKLDSPIVLNSCLTY